MRHSSKVVWGCVAILALAIILSVAFTSASLLLLVFVVCAVMIGAMVWMMRDGGQGGPPDGGRS